MAMQMHNRWIITERLLDSHGITPGHRPKTGHILQQIVVVRCRDWCLEVGQSLDNGPVSNPQHANTFLQPAAKLTSFTTAQPNCNVLGGAEHPFKIPRLDTAPNILSPPGRQSALGKLLNGVHTIEQQPGPGRNRRIPGRGD